MTHPDFSTGTRVRSTVTGATGTVVDPGNLPVPAKNQERLAYWKKVPSRIVFLLDSPKDYNTGSPPYYVGKRRFTKILPESSDQNRFEEEKEDFLAAEKNYVPANYCSSCHTNTGEFINGAYKCSICWKVW